MAARPRENVAAVQLKARALALHLASLAERSRVPAVASVFKCVQPPPISLDSFAERLGEHLFCSEAPFVAAYVLLDRLFLRFPELFCELSLHKLLSGSLVLAIKLQEDQFYSNRYYSTCFGVDLAELNALEAVFANLLDFELFVSQREGDLAGVELKNLETWLHGQLHHHHHSAAAPDAAAFPEFDFSQDINWGATEHHHHNHHNQHNQQHQHQHRPASGPKDEDHQFPPKPAPAVGRFDDNDFALLFNAAMIGN